MPDISLLQLAKSLQSNAASSIVQRLGFKWPPPPPISIRSLFRCRPNFQWTNYERTQNNFTPLSLCTPSSVGDLVAIVRNAEANSRKIHALGSGWSFSDCAMTTDVMVDTHFLNKPLNTVQMALNGTQPPFVYHVEAGISIRDLYTVLDRSGDPNSGTPLALETMGGASGQTLAGAVSTGTHGGNLFMGPLADSVLAIHLVGPGGVQYWIEPTAAITDKSLLRQFVVPDVAPENIIYDDDWFNSVLVSVGCMGIIYAVVLRVRPQYFLIETTAVTTWQDFKQTAAEQLADGTIQFLQVAINPYTDTNGTNSALVTTRKESSLPPSALVPPVPPVTPPTDRVLNAMIGLCGDLLAAIAKDPLGAGFDAVKLVVDTLKPLLDKILAAIESGTGLDLSDFTNASKQVIQLVNNILTDAPELRAVLTTDYSNIMAANWPPRTVGDASFKVMDSRFRGQQPDDPLPTVDPVGAYSIELFLPTQVIGGNPPAPYYVNFVENLIGLVNVATRTFLLGYVGIRFTGSTRAFLGMQQWDQTCSVEVSTLPDVLGERDLLADILDLIYDYPRDPALPLPHWGQMIDLNIQGYADRYPNYAIWQEVYAALSNNFTTRTFANALSDRWQLTFPPKYMSVDAKFLGRTLDNKIVKVTIQVTVQDATTGAPLAGATVTVSGSGKASGNTDTNGTVKLTYPQCVDPDTKTPRECQGLARKDRYQDVYFLTPID